MLIITLKDINEPQLHAKHFSEHFHVVTYLKFTTTHWGKRQNSKCKGPETEVCSRELQGASWDGREMGDEVGELEGGQNMWNLEGQHQNINWPWAE